MVNWLDTSKRIKSGNSKNLSERPGSIKDLGIITHSSAFRRLSRKTQVFINPEHDYIRTRLSHSLEVSQIGRELARYFLNRVNLKWTEFERVEFENTTSNACLIHDIGHPPFGHTGEEIIKENLADEFEANKQNIRIIYGLGFEEKILDLSRPLVDSVIKYKSNKSKEPSYESEKEKLKKNSYETGTIDFRNPICYLMEAADDIAYICGDIEDAKKLNIKIDVLQETLNSLKETLKIKDSELSPDLSAEKITSVLMYYFIKIVKKTINKISVNAKSKENLPEHIHSILNRDKHTSQFNLLYFENDKLSKIKDIFYYNGILKSSKICSERVAGKNILRGLIKYYSNYINMDSKQLVKTDFIHTLPEHIQKKIIKKDNLYKQEKTDLVRDYISGMTDNYAIESWKKICGLKL